MDLRTVQAALADIERQQKRIGNKIEHRTRVIAEAQVEVARLRRELSDLVDKHIELGGIERDLKENE